MNRREKGQATMEVAAALVAIVFLVAGFLTIGGVGITGIKSLLLTRYKAENEAASGNEGGGSSVQISDWKYTSVRRGDAEYSIPFLAGDEASRTALTANGDYFGDESTSLSMHPERTENSGDADYVFAGFGALPGAVIPGAVLTGNSTQLAALHFQGAVMPDGTEHEPNYLLRKDRGKRSWRDSMRASGWIGAEPIRIEEWPSSTFAFPAFGPRR